MKLIIMYSIYMYNVQVVRNVKKRQLREGGEEKAGGRGKERMKGGKEERRKGGRKEERLLLNPHLKCVHIPQPILHMRVHY